jgi:hypothetical protein
VEVMKGILGILLLSVVSVGYAQTYVKGYTKSNGTYVAPHYRSNADKNVYNNWSTKGNSNPYTGKSGYKNPYSYGSYRY